MSDKTFEAVDVDIDELALSLVGWQVVDAQARLVTEKSYEGMFSQRVALSATFRFLPEDWTDRFKSSRDDSYASEVLLTLNGTRDPAPSSNYKWVIIETIRKATKGLIRVSHQTSSWICREPLSSQDIEMSLTAYDLAEVADVAINSSLSLPIPTKHVKVAVVDETSYEGLRAEFLSSTAYLSEGDYRSTLTVHTEGSFAFDQAAELLNAYQSQHGQLDPHSTVRGTAPFEVNVPELKFEILDETGFLLDERILKFYGQISVDKNCELPRRRPRWIGRRVFDLSQFPGEPDRVIVRVTDSDQ